MDTPDLTAAGADTTSIQVLGAMGLGFVLGWTLYFANRGRSGKISATELASIAGIIFGSAITGFFDESALLLGGYGLGLFAGFVTLFALTAYAFGRQDGGGLGRAIERMTVPPSDNEEPAMPLSSVGSSGRERTETPGRTEVRAELERLRERLFALILIAGDARDAASGDERTALTEELRDLVALRREASLTLSLNAFTSPELLSLKIIAEEEARKLKDEASRLKRLTGAATQIASVVEAVTGTVTAIKSFAS